MLNLLIEVPFSKKKLSCPYKILGLFSGQCNLLPPTTVVCDLATPLKQPNWNFVQSFLDWIYNVSPVGKCLELF